jgi:hypothetical protein
LASNVGEVVGVVSMLGADTMVSLGAGAGSIGSLALVSVTVGVVVDATSFILALVLVGGINLMALGNVQVGSDQAELQEFCAIPSHGPIQLSAGEDSLGGASSRALTAAKTDRSREWQM